MTLTGTPFSHRLRILALRTGASRRGLAPTIRIESAWSIPAMVALKRYDARPNFGCALEPSWRQSRFFDPSRVIRSFSANISSTLARSPAIAPIRAGEVTFTFAAIAAKASAQLADL